MKRTTTPAGTACAPIRSRALRPGCTFVAEFMTAAHLVLVWEERDDPNLLRHAGRAKEVGRNPHVVTYEPGFGPSASYYAWEAAGRPVHGIRRQARVIESHFGESAPLTRSASRRS